jgi:hypothetical protein
MVYIEKAIVRYFESTRILAKENCSLGGWLHKSNSRENPYIHPYLHPSINPSSPPNTATSSPQTERVNVKNPASTRACMLNR